MATVLFSLLRISSRFRSSRGHRHFGHGLLESHPLREQLPITSMRSMHLHGKYAILYRVLIYSSGLSLSLPPLLYFLFKCSCFRFIVTLLRSLPKNPESLASSPVTTQKNKQPEQSGAGGSQPGYNLKSRPAKCWPSGEDHAQPASCLANPPQYDSNSDAEIEVDNFDEGELQT